MRVLSALVLVVTLTLPTGLVADFRYTQTTQVTGGSLLNMMAFAGKFSRQARQIGDPVTSTVYIRGNRMARVGTENTEIIDLDAETITHIDHQRRQYYTITFQQMKEQMEEAQRDEARRSREHPAPAATPEADNTDVNFDVAVRSTGARRQHSGMETTESIMTVTMRATDHSSGESGNLAMSNDLWLAPEIRGYQEVRDFQVRYAQKMGAVYAASLAPVLASTGQMRAGSAQGLGAMAREVSKLKGVPVYTVMRMGSTADGSPLPAASEAPLPPPQQQSASAGDATGEAAKQGATDSASSAIASKLGLGGMLGGMGRHRKDHEQPPAAAAPTESQATPILMETTTEISGFSGEPIAPSFFLPPSGYQQVAPPARARP